jgi:hypothetical protein
MGAPSLALAQDALPVPEEQQVLEALESPQPVAMPEAPMGEASPSPQDAAAAPEGEATVNPNPLSSLEIESLSATLSAPLFTPSRTGPIVEEPIAPVVEAPPPAPEVPPEQPPPPLQLVGIVMTDATKVALLKDPGTNEVHRLNSGEEYEGWSVMVVDGRSIEFRSGDRVEGLKMFESFPTPANYGVPGMPNMPFDPTMPQPNQPPMPDPAGFPQQPPTDPALQQPPPDPQLEGTSPDATRPEGAVPEAPAELPPNFDPQTGELIIPQEGPLDADGDPNTPN